MELLKYELYKILSRPITVLAMVVFLGLSLFLAYDLLRFDPWSEYRELYREWEGPLTVEKAAAAEQRQQEYQDSRIGNADMFNLLSRLLRTWIFVQERSILMTELSEKIEVAEAVGTTDFAYRQNVLHYKMLEDIRPPAFAYYYGWERVLEMSNNYGVFFITALILLVLAPVFAAEYNCGMDSLILASRHGRKKLVTAKILAPVIVIAGFALLFTAIIAAAAFYVHGFSGGDLLISNSLMMTESPYNYSMAEYFILHLAVQIFGIVSFSLVALLASVFNRSPLVVIFIAGFVFAAPPMLQSLYELDPLNYMELIRVTGMFDKFLAFNIFGRPVLFPYVNLVFFGCLSAAILYFIYLGFRNRRAG